MHLIWLAFLLAGACIHGAPVHNSSHPASSSSRVYEPCPTDRCGAKADPPNDCIGAPAAYCTTHCFGGCEYCCANASTALGGARLMDHTESSACDARALITQHEGKRSCVYTDTKGHPTVGIGYNLDNSGARAAIAAVGADYDNVRSGKQCLTDTQIQNLFAPAYESAVSEAERVVSSFASLCCEVQEVMTDMTYNLGSLSSFNTFVSLINQKSWSSAARDGRSTAWCGQTKGRCTDDMNRVQNGCGGPTPTPPTPTPTPPSPTPPSSSCKACILGGGGIACGSRCANCSSACRACIKGAGGKACAARCC